jgi:hypothetical protein
VNLGSERVHYKLVSEQLVHYKLVSEQLVHYIIYGTSTNKTCLRLVLGLVTNPHLHRLYIKNYNKQIPKYFIKHNFL